MSEIAGCASCGARVRVPAAAEGKPRCPVCKAALPWVAAADDTDFATVADSSRVPVLVDLWAAWCAPCRTLSPLLERLAAERPGRLKLVKVNVDHAPRTQAAFGVQAIPTLVLLNGGREVSRQTGALPLAALRAWVDASLG